MSKQVLWSLLALASGSAVVAVLATTPVLTQGNVQQGVRLPEGSAKSAVETKCTTCHVLDRIVNSRGYTNKGWDIVVTSMVKLPDGERSSVVDYLAKNFPQQPKPAGVIVPGDISVNIREWLVPSLGSRPHEVVAASDGSIWWTANWGNLLGRLDPKTGAMKEFPVATKTPRPGPHSIAQDKAGDIWYTANLNGRIGRFTPASGNLTEYPMPLITAWDPHTLVIDQQGIVWFTVQRGNMIGRLMPATGQVTLSAPPTLDSHPYGMALDSHGTPWFAQFTVNKLGHIDPRTMVVVEHTLPNPASRPRRVAVDADDAIWYTDFSRGYLGRFDPKTGRVSEWASPSGPKSEPFGITVVKGEIWYSESGTRPNTLVRFNPTSQKFQSWAIPDAGVVPNMTTTADGNIALVCMGFNRIALAEIARP